ncbi:hypothetical protein WA026_009936 [Henosepilachna vigintioctopunctata]|uniref:Uncharacterized protein n=1 Tax=Henosepilachna vigintioctopunctata TaxID=420089 RepID=A0AAW1TQP1_9CUCU
MSTVDDLKKRGWKGGASEGSDQYVCSEEHPRGRCPPPSQELLGGVAAIKPRRKCNRAALSASSVPIQRFPTLPFRRRVHS